MTNNSTNLDHGALEQLKRVLDTLGADLESLRDKVISRSNYASGQYGDWNLGEVVGQEHTGAHRTIDEHLETDLARLTETIDSVKRLAEELIDLDANDAAAALNRLGALLGGAIGLPPASRPRPVGSPTGPTAV